MNPYIVLKDRMKMHDAGHGTYFPHQCKECKALGWIDKKGQNILDLKKEKAWRFANSLRSLCDEFRTLDTFKMATLLEEYANFLRDAETERDK